MTVSDDGRLALDLERAVTYRFLSLLFRPPTTELAGELASLAPLLPAAQREQAASLVGSAPPALEQEYHVFLGASGNCPDCETDYEVNPLGGKGPLLADVAGFYAAFRYGAPAELRLQPDHVAMELDFLAYLGAKTAYARAADLALAAEVSAAAAETFTRDHAGRWLPAFWTRLADAAGDRFHGRAAQLAMSIQRAGR